MVNSSRRKSSTARKSFAKQKTDRVETIEENEVGKNKNLSSVTSEPSTEVHEPDDEQLETLEDNTTSLERSAQDPAAVPSRQNSFTASQSKENASDILANQENVIESELNRTGISNVSEHRKEETNGNNMARAYGKCKNAKDTPTHLYGLDGALMSSDEDADVDMEDNLREYSRNQLQARFKYFVRDHWKRALSGFSVFVVTGILISIIVQVYSSWSVSGIPEVDPNSETLRIIEEKVDRLSSVLQVIASNSADSLSADNKSLISEKIVQQIVQEALERYNADKVGMADFALESSGAEIHSTYHSTTYDVGAARIVFLGIPLWVDMKAPRVILQADNSPGNCWAFQGNQGFVVIKLAKMLIPSAFSLEHIPKSLSPTGDGRIESAPKEFTIWGWKDPNGNERVKLGFYIFDNQGHFIQTFKIQHLDGTETFQYIELRILSNHGQPQYTCIYRFRVHGNPHL